MQEFAGKVALVTGGGSGIGRAAAAVLAERGAEVAIWDRDEAAVARTVMELAGRPGSVHGHVVDVTEPDDVHGAIQGVLTRSDRLDVVVTAAGIQRYGDVAETTPSQWDEVLDVNVKGCAFVVRAALPSLRETSGAVVIVSSVQAYVAQGNAGAYVTSKAALGGLTRSIAVDEARFGVRANMVCPGSVDTPMLRASARGFSDGTPAGEQARLAEWGALHPLGRIARAEEIAEAIAFLASGRASFVTGASLPVDGGLLASVVVRVD